MGSFKLFILGLGALFMLQGCTCIKTKAVKSKSLEDVITLSQKHLKTVKPEDILVLFDINYTLTYPKNPYFQMKNIKQYQDVWAAQLSKQQIDYLLSLAVKEHENVLLDPKALDVLTKLQQMGVKTIAFTAALAGKVGDSVSITHHVYQELKALGINFEHSFSNVKDVIFKDLIKYHGAYPCYYKGILCSNGEASGLSKGEVLIHFLKHIQYTPKVVIIADDRRVNIDGLEVALNKAYPHIKLEALEYIYGYTLPAPTVSREEFQKFIANLRQKTLSIT